jgi:hypothetical protein
LFVWEGHVIPYYFPTFEDEYKEEPRGKPKSFVFENAVVNSKYIVGGAEKENISRSDSVVHRTSSCVGQKEFLINRITTTAFNASLETN